MIGLLVILEPRASRVSSMALAQFAALSSNPEPQPQSVVQKLRCRDRQAASFLRDALPGNTHDLIHHHLRRGFQSRARPGSDRDAKQRRVDQMRSDRTQSNAGVCLVEKILRPDALQILAQSLIEYPVFALAGLDRGRFQAHAQFIADAKARRR